MSAATATIDRSSTAQDAASSELVALHQRELREQGVTVFHDVISPERLAAMRASIDAFLERPEMINSHEDSYGAPNLVSWGQAFCDVATHPLLLAVFEGLIGKDCILSSCNFGARRPGGLRQQLHRDTGIWGDSMPFMPVPLGIQTAWCIDDFTLENGATYVVPGSHADPSVEGSREVQRPARAGSIIAFDCQALHAGGGNRTQAIRRGVLTLYIRSWLKPQTDHKRSVSRELIEGASPELLRLLGFQRQSPAELPDGRSVVIDAPGATSFYGQPPSATVRY